MGNPSYRLHFDLRNENGIDGNSEKERLQISKLTKFGAVKFQIAEDIYDLAKFADFVYIIHFVLRAKIAYIISNNCCAQLPHALQMFIKSANFAFHIFQHYVNKLCSFINFETLFLNVMIKFLVLDQT